MHIYITGSYERKGNLPYRAGIGMETWEALLTADRASFRITHHTQFTQGMVIDSWQKRSY